MTDKSITVITIYDIRVARELESHQLEPSPHAITIII